MAGRCGTGEARSRRLAGRFSAAAASMLPGALLVLLPKCPLCLAAWLTLATGIGVSAGSAGLVRELMVVFCFAAAAFGIVQAYGATRRGERGPGGSLRGRSRGPVQIVGEIRGMGGFRIAPVCLEGHIGKQGDLHAAGGLEN